MLQEAGEIEVVLEIGDKLLRERLPKSFKQDVVLAMALAYVDMSRDAMALNPPDFIRGCEMLERALKLLQVFNYINLNTLFLFFDAVMNSFCFICISKNSESSKGEEETYKKQKDNEKGMGGFF